MSLYGLLSTSASGMSAQTSLLSTVSDNISNSGTNGYKNVTSDFSTLVLNSGSSAYQSGGVQAHTVLNLDGQGTITSTSANTNLAIQGTGFFIVQGPNGQPVLTRDGSFTKNSSGELVNSSGYALMGLTPGAVPVSNGLSGLSTINIGTLSLKATPTDSGKLYVNLPSSASVSTSYQTSMVAYDNLGNQVTLDVTFTNAGATSTTPALPQWSVQASNPSTSPATAVGSPVTLTFDPKSGDLYDPTATSATTTTPASSASPTNMTFTVPNGAQMTLDLSKSTQLSASYTVLSSSTNGSAPSAVSGVSIGADGTVSATYESGATQKVFTIPLATVPSPNNMSLVSGTAYAPNLASGQAQVGTAGTSGLGSIESGSLENSTVDLASQLTVMIAAQNNYQADSKVFETGSTLLSVLINMKQ